MPQLKDRLVEAAHRVWRAFLKFGPVDDGRPEGDEFDDALLHLRATAKRTKFQTTQERRALVAIVNAADLNPQEVTGQVKEAIARAKKTLEYSDLVAEEDR